jgi:hypothetical protein
LHCSVVAALHAGQISARNADTFLRLNPGEQARESERRFSEAHERETRLRLVADAIRGYLDGCSGRKVNLTDLRKIIREVLPV